MTNDFISQGIQAIASFFDGKYKDESIRMVTGAIQPEPETALRAAYSRCCTEFNTLPPIAKVRDIIIQEGRKIREAEICQREQAAEKMKAEERKPWNPGNDEHGKACCKFLQAAFSGEYSHDELREMAEEGEGRFPGRGFDIWLNGKLKQKPVELMRRAAGE